MKILNMLFVIFICFLASCTEVTNPSYIDDIEEYMPLSIGNYWVYDVYDSLYNRSYIDSMVVVSDTTIMDKKMFVVHNYSNEYLRDTGYYCVSDYSIALYGKVLMPLLWTPDESCFSKQTKKIFSILDNKEKWSCRDSVIADSLPSIIIDNKTIWSVTARILNIDAKQTFIQNYNYNNSSVKSIKIQFDGNRVLRILEPENVQFPHLDGYEYFDNDRAVIGNKLLLNLKFAKGIGIISSYEKAWLQYNFCQTRTLLRYNVK